MGYISKKVAAYGQFVLVFYLSDENFFSMVGVVHLYRFLHKTKKGTKNISTKNLKK